MDAAEKEISNADVMQRIIINYFQVISLASNFPFEWPPLLDFLFNSSGFFSSIGENMFRIECLFPAIGKANVYYTRQVLYALVPFGAVFLLFWYWKLHSYCTGTLWTRRNADCPITSKDRFVISATSTLYLLYPYNCKMAFGAILSCRQLGDKSFLAADMSEPCYEGKHYVFLIIFGVMQIFFYVVGLPLLVWYFLWKNRARLDDYVVKLRWGLFYRGYRRQRYYWEVLVMLRKSLIVLISMMSVQNVSMQAGLAVIAVQLFLFLHSKLVPYSLDKDTNVLNKMEFNGLICAFVCMWAGMVNFQKVDEEEGGNVFATTVTILTFVFNVLFIVWATKKYFSQFLKDNDYFEKYTSTLPKPVRNTARCVYTGYRALYNGLLKLVHALFIRRKDAIGEHENWDRVFSVEHQAFYFIHDATMTVMWEYYDEVQHAEISREGRLYPRQHGWYRYWDPSRSRKLRAKVGVSRWYFHHEEQGTKWSAAKEEPKSLAHFNPLTSLKTFGKMTVENVGSFTSQLRRKFTREARSNPATEMTTIEVPQKAMLTHKAKRPSTYDMWKRFYDEIHGSYCYENIKHGHIKWEDPETGQNIDNVAPENGWRLYNDDSSAREYFHNEDADYSFWVYSPAR